MVRRLSVTGSTGSGRTWIVVDINNRANTDTLDARTQVLVTDPAPLSGSGGNPERCIGHVPVLLRESVDLLVTDSAGVYVDATFGGGGHSRAILQRLNAHGRVVAVDADPSAVDRGRTLAKDPDVGGRFQIVHANFAELGDVLHDIGISGVAGVLFDLGLSSFQLDDRDRGFSFRLPGPIDMRMDPSRGAPVSALVNELPEEELARIFFAFGEEPKSRRIARAIVREREQRPFARTDHLAEAVSRAVGGRRGADTHPATRTFQALRIAANEELSSIADGLRAAAEVLRPGGRLVAISFHSLEDRLVKRFIADQSSACVCPPELPVCICATVPNLHKVTGRAVRPGADEVAANPRARSAVLRAAERLPVTRLFDERTSHATLDADGGRAAR